MYGRLHIPYTHADGAACQALMPFAKDGRACNEVRGCIHVSARSAIQFEGLLPTLALRRINYIEYIESII